MKRNTTKSNACTILFVATHPSAPGEYIRVAEQLRSHGYNAVICLATPRAIGNVQSDQRDALQYLSIDGSQINWSVNETSSDILKPKKNSSMIRNVLRSYSWLAPLRGLVTVMQLWRSLLSERSSVSLLFARIQPDIVIVPGDRQPRLEATIAELSRQRGTPFVCAPTCQIAAPATLALRRPAVPLNAINRFFSPRYWLSRFIPAQTYVTDEKTVNFYTPATALLLLVFKVLPMNPWQMGGGGRADFLFVHGQADQDLQIAAGLPFRKTLVLGQPSTDLLHEQLVKEAKPVSNEDIGIEKFRSDRPTAVFAVPQPFSDAPNWTWNSLRSVRDSLITAGYNVLLSIHPKQRVENYTFLELDGYAHLARAPLVSFLGYSDLYISSYSSTVRWAMLLGLPLAVIDYHGENSPIFNDLPMIPILHSTSALEAWLSGMKNSISRLQLGEKLRAVSSYYQCFDGRSTDRVVMKIIEIIEPKNDNLPNV